MDPKQPLCVLDRQRAVDGLHGVERRDGATVQVAEWDTKRAVMPVPRPVENLPNPPATASFQVAPNGEWQRFLTHPNTDLFVLRPFNGKTVDWECLWSPVPIFDQVESFYVSHIALDYDPGWLTEGEHLPYLDSWASPGTIGCAIRAATDQLRWVENLWFVDYRIRRRPGALPTTSSRYQFHGNGCTITEVREGDTDWEVEHPRSIFRFLEELYEQEKEYCDYMEGNTPGGPSVPTNTPYVGVLAYEVCGY